VERSVDDLVQATPEWRAAHPGAAVGVLVLRGVANPPRHSGLEALVAGLERDLRARFGGLSREDLWATPPLPAYAAYFKRFGQRYHVARQLESVVDKGKPIPRVAALVEAMFAAELRHLILTAGHDLDAVPLPLRIDVGTGAERFTTPRGDETAVKPGDIYCADQAGVLSAVIGGPAARARISAGTTNALFVAYAVPGVPRPALTSVLNEIQHNAEVLTGGPVKTDRVVVVAAGEDR